jgi:hypothetical protein
MIYMVVSLDANGIFTGGWRVGARHAPEERGIAFSGNLDTDVAGSFQAPIQRRRRRSRRRAAGTCSCSTCTGTCAAAGLPRLRSSYPDTRLCQDPARRL